MNPQDPVLDAHADVLVVKLTQHYDELVGYVHRKFGDGDFARDIVHAVCAELLDQPPPNAIRQPLAFLRSVLMHRAIDQRRGDMAQRKVQQAYADTRTVTTETPHSPADASSRLNLVQQVEALAHIVRALPGRPRQVFILHRLYDMSLSEIAVELDVSLNMINRHYSTAVQRIREQWEPMRSLPPRP